MWPSSFYCAIAPRWPTWGFTVLRNTSQQPGVLVKWKSLKFEVESWKLLTINLKFCFSNRSPQSRMEKLAAKTRSNQAKVVGNTISIPGAFVLTFYKGPSIISAYTQVSSLLHQPFRFLKSDSVDATWAIASILLIAHNFLTSSWYILQAGDHKSLLS